MDPIIGASIIGAGASLLGGAMGDRSADRTNQASLDFSYHQLRRQVKENRLDRNMQRLFAERGLRMRVADARAAGVHPLVALGAQLNPSSPVSGVGGSGPALDSGSRMGDAVRAAGAMIAESVARRDKEKAETRLLNAQADLVTQQAADSQVARITQGMQNDVVIPEFHDVQNPQHTPRLNVGGIPVKTAPTTDAQTFEDRYGEVGGSALGLINLPADIFWSIKEQVISDLKRDPGRVAREMRQFRSFNW